MTCIQTPVFVPDLSLALPGDFDSITQSGTATIDMAAGKIHTVSQTKTVSDQAYVTKDVFGPGGSTEMYIKVRIQEVLGQDFGADLFYGVTIRDTAASFLIRLAFQIGREPFLFHFPDWGTSDGPAFDSSAHDFLICLDQDNDRAAFVEDGTSFDVGTSALGTNPFRYVQFGVLQDQGGVTEHFDHEFYFDAIEVGTGACSCFEAVTGNGYGVSSTFGGEG